MKKYAKLLLVLVMSLVLFTGCGMKQNIEMNISNDENVSLSLIIAMDNEMIDAMLNSNSEEKSDSNSISDAKRWEYLDSSSNDMPADYKKEKYDVDGYKGYKYTIDLGKLSDITKDSASEKVNLAKISSGEKITDKVLFIKDGDTYKSNMTYQVENETDYSSYTSAGANIEINYVINLPEKAKSSNADNTENDGKKLSWSLLKSNDINVEFNVKKNNTVLYIVIGCIAGLILIVCVVVIILSKKNKKTNNEIKKEQ